MSHLKQIKAILMTMGSSDMLAQVHGDAKWHPTMEKQSEGCLTHGVPGGLSQHTPRV